MAFAQLVEEVSDPHTVSFVKTFLIHKEVGDPAIKCGAEDVTKSTCVETSPSTKK